MSFKLKVDKSGWNKLRKDLMKISENELQVGWFENNRYGPDNSNLPMAYVAALNEMGHVNGADAMIPGAITPPRPFMRVGFRQAMNTPAAEAEFNKMIEKVVSGQSSLVALKQSANFFENLLQKVMRDWDTPPNASLTIEMKGFNDPLRNTGELIDNVTAKVSKRGG